MGMLTPRGQTSSLVDEMKAYNYEQHGFGSDIDAYLVLRLEFQELSRRCVVTRLIDQSA